MMPSGILRHWCRTLGNYSAAPRVVHNIEWLAATSTNPTSCSHRDNVMSLKTPRNPNPNIALLNRRQLQGTACALGTTGVATQFGNHVIPSAQAATTAAGCTLSPSLTEAPRFAGNRSI
jgi:hypothetical protein